MKIENIRTIHEVESKEEFSKSIYYSPMLTTLRQITFKIKGISLTTTVTTSVKRLTVHGQRIGDWLTKNRLTLSNYSVDKALIETKYMLNSLRNTDLLESTNKFVLINENDDKYANEMFKMMNEQDTTLVSNIYKEDSNNLSDYKYSWLYRYAKGYTTVYERNEPIDDIQMCVSHIGYLLSNVFMALDYDIRELDTYEDVIQLKDALEDYGIKDCSKELLQEFKTSFELWNALSSEEIQEFKYKMDEDTATLVDEYLDRYKG